MFVRRGTKRHLWKKEFRVIYSVAPGWERLFRKSLLFRKSAGKHIFVVCPPGSTPAPPSTPHGRCHKSCTGGQTFFQSSSGKVPAARCRCRVRTPMPLRGACGLPVQAEHRLVGRTVYTAHNKCGGRQDTAAGCGGKVPLPGAHANAPPGGVRRLTFARQRSVSIATFAAHNKRGQRRERM